MSKLLITVGEISKKIGEELKKYIPKMVCIDDHLSFPKSLQQAEENAVALDFETLFNKPETYKTIIFVLDGGENVTGCSLAILEYFKNQNIQILYIKPDLSYADDAIKYNHEIVSQVLQEKTRSGTFERFYFLDMVNIDEYISKMDNVSIANYYNKVAEFVSQIFYNILWISSEKPIFGKIKESKEINRISTIGIIDISGNNVFPFYKMEVVREVEYYILLGKEEINRNSSLLKEIRNNITKLTSNQGLSSDETSTSYGIYETDYSHSQYYCRLNTNLVQESQYLTENKK